MAFFKFRQRGHPQPNSRLRAEPSAADEAQESIDSLRRRARNRLLGAAILVLAGVIIFPILFDREPRPVAVDAPIIIPDRHQQAPLVDARAPDGEPVPPDAALDEREELVTSTPVVVADTSSRAYTSAISSSDHDRVAPEMTQSEEARARNADQDTAAPEQVQQREHSQRAEKERADKERLEKERAQRAAREQQAQAERAKQEQLAREKRERQAQQEKARRDAERARTLLEGTGGVSSAAITNSKARYIVQIGAFADDSKVRQVRQQAQSAGVKTYIQIFNTKDGKRTRVRVGPYSSRTEAERAVSALKKAGLSGVVMSL